MQLYTTSLTNENDIDKSGGWEKLIHDIGGVVHKGGREGD